MASEDIKEALMLLQKKEPERMANLIFNVLYSAGAQAEVRELEMAVLNEVKK